MSSLPSTSLNTFPDAKFNTTGSTIGSIIDTTIDYSTVSTTATTVVSHLRLLNNLFLQSVSCQVITGFFAWAALLITAQHVNIDLLLEIDSLILKGYFFLKKDIFTFTKL